MYAIGIDIGTTSICGVLVDIENGKIVESRTELSNAFVFTENPWEKIQNTEKVISLAMDILEDFLEYPIRAIGLTGQMHGIVYVDKDGKAVSPLYTWQDIRGNQPYNKSTYAEHLGSFAGYGNVTDFYNRVNHIRPMEAVAHCTIMDYLAMTLCKNKKPIIHTTNAASLGCFDMQKNKFDYEIGVEVSNGFEVVGTYEGIPVSVAIGDNQASVFATLADEKDLLVNVGTGSQISVVSNQIVTGENIETRPYFDGKYLIVGAALCGGRAYAILKDFYTSFLQAAGTDKKDVYEVMNGLMEGMNDSPLKVDTRFAGTRSQPTLTGQIQGISIDNFTPENLTYGVLKGMMAELYNMYVKMGENRINLVGSGNGIRKNKTLVKIAEKMFGGKMKIPVHTEEAACGAALFALVACGVYDSPKQIQKLIIYE